MPVHIIPKEGITDTSSLWDPFLKKTFESYDQEAVIEIMPSSEKANIGEWLAFLEEKTKNNPETILVGHGRSAVAAMRLAEKQPMNMLVLVAPYYTDLNNPSEKETDLFDTPWNWKKIKENVGLIIVNYSRNDPIVTVEESRKLCELLHAEYFEEESGHFDDEGCTELFSIVDSIRRTFEGNLQ